MWFSLGMSLRKAFPDPADWWRRGLWVLPVFYLGSLLAYGGVRNVPFLSDDYANLGNFFAQGFYWTWGEFPWLFFRPLTVLSQWLDLQFWGLHPLPHHIVNMLWHGVNAALVTWFAKFWFERFLGSGSGRAFLPAVLAGAVFLVLPTHTEAVAYIGSRGDLLATCFSLLALNTFARYLEHGRPAHVAWMLFALAAGLFSKESAMSLLPVFGILGAGLWRTAPDRRAAGSRMGKALAASVAVAAAYYAIRFGFIRSWVGAYGFHSEWLRPIWWLPNLGTAVWRMFIPVLSFEQAEVLRRLPGWVGWGCGAGLGGLLAWGAGRPSANRSAAPAWWLTGFGACALVSAYPAILMSLRIDYVAGERWLYLPNVFGAIGLIALGVRVLRERRTWLVVMSALILLYAAGLQRTLRYWTAAGRMVQDILRDSVDLVTGHRLLVLNLPNDLNGVYVFRIGFNGALQIFEPMRLLAQLERITRSPNGSGPVVKEAIAQVRSPGAPTDWAERFGRAEEALRTNALAQTPEGVKARRHLHDLRVIASLTGGVGAASFHVCHTPRDRVRVRSVPGGVDLQVDPPSTFLPMPVPEGVHTTLTSAQTAEVRFVKGPPPAGVDVLYWDAGRLKRWTP